MAISVAPEMLEKELNLISSHRETIDKGFEDLKRMQRDIKPVVDCLSHYRQAILATREPGLKLAEEVQKFGEKYQFQNKWAEGFLHIGQLQLNLEQLRYEWQCKLWDNLILPSMNSTESVKRDLEQSEKHVKAKAQKIEAAAKKAKQDADKQKKKNKADAAVVDASLNEQLNALKGEIDVLRLYLNNFSEQLSSTWFKPFGTGMADQLHYHDAALKAITQGSWRRLLDSEPTALPDIGLHKRPELRPTLSKESIFAPSPSPPSSQNASGNYPSLGNSSNLTNSTSSAEEEAVTPSSSSPPPPSASSQQPTQASPSSAPPTQSQARPVSPQPRKQTRRLSMTFRRKSVDTEPGSSPYQQMKPHIARSGYLSVREGTKNKWSKRWVVLTPETLAFFKDDPEKGSEVLKGSLIIRDIVQCEPTTSLKKVSACITVSIVGKSYFLQCSSDEEAKEWIQAVKISTKIEQQFNAAPSGSSPPSPSVEVTPPSPKPEPSESASKQSQHDTPSTKPLPVLPSKPVPIKEIPITPPAKQATDQTEATSQTEASKQNEEEEEEKPQNTSPKEETSNNKSDWVQYQTDDGQIAFQNTVTGELAWEVPT